MAYDAILDSQIQVGDAITQGLLQKVKDNFDFLYGLSSGDAGSVINNGSFDVDSDSDGEPDNWTITNYAGGSNALVTSNSMHGGYALKFTHPSGAGNGGGYADSDYIPCSSLYPFYLEFLHLCSQSGVKVQVVVRFFSEAKVDLSADQTIYSETTNPTTTSVECTSGCVPPAAAQFMKIRMIGGYTDTNPGSSTDIYFDRLEIKHDAYTSNGASVGDYLVFAHGTLATGGTPIASAGTSTSLIKIAEAKIIHSGQVDTQMFFSTESVQARIYVNGAAVGTLHSGTGGLFVDYAVDVERGDLLQIYAKHNTGTGNADLLGLKVHSETPAPAIAGFDLVT